MWTVPTEKHFCLWKSLVYCSPPGTRCWHTEDGCASSACQAVITQSLRNWPVFRVCIQASFKSGQKVRSCEPADDHAHSYLSCLHPPSLASPSQASHPGCHVVRERDSVEPHVPARGALCTTGAPGSLQLFLQATGK